MKLLNNRYGTPNYLLGSYRKEINALPFVKPGNASGFRKFYSFLLTCETFLKATIGMLLKLQKYPAFLIQSYLVALGIDGIERYRWLEEILGENHVYQILPVLYEETTLVHDPTFSKDTVLEYVQTPERKHDKKKRIIEVLP